MLLLALGLTAAALTLYAWWVGYLPLFTPYFDPASVLQMVEPAEWFVGHAANLTTLVPVFADGALPVPAL
jgi:hypothetical protein